MRLVNKTIDLWSVAVLLFLVCLWAIGCSSCVNKNVTATSPEVTRSQTEPTETTESDLQVSTCLRTFRMSKAATAAGIRPLHHMLSQVEGGSSTLDIPSELTLLPIGVSTEIGRLPVHTNNVAIHRSWLVDAGMGMNSFEQEGTLPPWIKVKDDGRIFATPSASLSGAILHFGLKSRSLDSDSPIHDARLHAFGKTALHFYQRFVKEYREVRIRGIKASGFEDLEEEEDRKVVEEVGIELVTLFAHDIGDTGNSDLILFSIVTYYDADRNEVAIHGELGVLPHRPDDPIVAIQIPRDQGVVFPSFLIVPKSLNGGFPMFLRHSYCCSGMSVDAYVYEPRRLRVHTHESVKKSETSRRVEVCVEPSVSGDARVIIKR